MEVILARNWLGREGWEGDGEECGCVVVWLCVICGLCWSMLVVWSTTTTTYT